MGKVDEEKKIMNKFDEWVDGSWTEQLYWQNFSMAGVGYYPRLVVEGVKDDENETKNEMSDYVKNFSYAFKWVLWVPKSENNRI